MVGSVHALPKGRMFKQWSELRRLAKEGTPRTPAALDELAARAPDI